MDTISKETGRGTTDSLLHLKDATEDWKRMSMHCCVLYLRENTDGSNAQYKTSAKSSQLVINKFQMPKSQLITHIIKFKP